MNAQKRIMSTTPNFFDSSPLGGKKFSSFIKQTALSVGFDACGIAKAEELTNDVVFLKQWLADGCNADMHYLERNFEKRIDPRELVPSCKSIVVVLMNYFPEQKQTKFAPQIAKYAYSYIDYHTVIKEKLKELEQKITEIYGNDCIAINYQHAFVDSAPVLERRWAQRAGLGWIGKHTQLIHPGLGSYAFIGILMLNVETEYDTPSLPHCGTCTRCIDACPTNALNDGSLDARHCISYQTIENKNEIPPEYHAKLSNYALGCDICADVCPWNKKWAKPHSHIELSPLLTPFEVQKGNDGISILEWSYKDWQQLTKNQFNEIFRYSAFKRAGFSKLKQNIEVLKHTNEIN